MLGAVRRDGIDDDRNSDAIEVYLGSKLIPSPGFLCSAQSPETEKWAYCASPEQPHSIS